MIHYSSTYGGLSSAVYQKMEGVDCAPPHMEGEAGENAPMGRKTYELRTVLATNLRRLKDSANGGLGEPEEAIARRARVGTGTINRLLNGETGVTLDKLVRVADAYGVPAWTLLCEGCPPMPVHVMPLREWEDLWRELQELRVFERSVMEAARRAEAHDAEASDAAVDGKTNRSSKDAPHGGSSNR